MANKFCVWLDDLLTGYFERGSDHFRFAWALGFCPIQASARSRWDPDFCGSYWVDRISVFVISQKLLFIKGTKIA